MGVYASPERQQVFDVNDFDETLAGPWEWDVKRLAASVVLAARQNGYSTQESRQAVVRGMQRYSFAEAYADQAERDHAALLTAITEGRVQAQTGV